MTMVIVIGAMFTGYVVFVIGFKFYQWSQQ